MTSAEASTAPKVTQADDAVFDFVVPQDDKSVAAFLSLDLAGSPNLAASYERTSDLLGSSPTSSEAEHAAKPHRTDLFVHDDPVSDDEESKPEGEGVGTVLANLRSALTNEPSAVSAGQARHESADSSVNTGLRASTDGALQNFPMLSGESSVQGTSMARSTGEGQSTHASSTKNTGEQAYTVSPPAAEKKTNSTHAPIRSRNVYVAALPMNFSEADLNALLTPFGKIKSCRMFTKGGRVNEIGRAYGFALFDDPDAAERAVATLDGMRYGNARLQCQLSRNGVVKKPKDARERVRVAAANQQEALSGSSFFGGSTDAVAITGQAAVPPPPFTPVGANAQPFVLQQPSAQSAVSTQSQAPNVGASAQPHHCFVPPQPQHHQQQYYHAMQPMAYPTTVMTPQHPQPQQQFVYAQAPPQLWHPGANGYGGLQYQPVMMQ